MKDNHVINDMIRFVKELTVSLASYPVTFELTYDADIRITFISTTTNKRATLTLPITHKFSDFYGDKAARTIIPLLDPKDIITSVERKQAS